MKKRRSSPTMAVLLLCLLLPALCMLPTRSAYRAHTAERSEEVLERKEHWEQRFNVGVMVVFPTAMFWILLVAPVYLLRQGKLETP